MFILYEIRVLKTKWRVSYHWFFYYEFVYVRTVLDDFESIKRLNLISVCIICDVHRVSPEPLCIHTDWNRIPVALTVA